MSASSRRLNDPAFLVGAWYLNNAPFDGSGHDYNMTWVGAPAYQFSPFGRFAGEFSVGPYLQNASQVGNALGNGRSNISASVWIRADNPAGNGGIFDIGPLGSAWGELSLAVNANTLRCVFDAGVRFTPAFTSTQWRHVVLTCEGLTPTVYLDGQFLASTALGQVFNCTGLPTSIGTYYAAGFAFDGGIANMRIYNITLTNDEVYTLFRRKM